jgi:hypothetical protein
MKAKKVLIVYNPSSGKYAGEAMFNEVVMDMKKEGRTITAINSIEFGNKTATFDDGSKVYLSPVGKPAIGIRVTHLYIDKSVYDIKNGKKYVNEALIPYVVPQGNYTNWDADSMAKSRIAVFEIGNNKLELKHFNVD